MASDDSREWRLNPVCRLHWRHWDQDYVLFNAASGQTHVVNELGADVLRLLEVKPASADELFEALAVRHGLAPDPELAAGVQRLLADLDQLGLIEPPRA